MTSKKDFERILERYLNGTATEQEIKWVEKWYSTLDSAQDSPVLNERDEKNLHQRDWQDIQKRIGKKNSRLLFHWPYLAAAAAVTLIIGVVLIYSVDQDPAKTNLAKTQTSSTEQEIVNESSEIKTIRLPDSSTVVLQPHSTIRISANFNKGDRAISLKGEAFFDVVRDEKRPFKVFTHDVISTVLGTSFTIKAPSANEKIIVAVKTGRVAVSSIVGVRGSAKVKSQEVIVTPNQQAVFNPESNVLKATLVQNPVTLPLPEQTQSTKTKEIFDEEPIINILQNIERMYGIKIEYDEATLSACRITTAFLNEGLYERLDILSKAIGGMYRVEGTQIIFQSKGCVTSQ